MFFLSNNSLRWSDLTEFKVICLSVKFIFVQERDEISYESYARIEHMLTGCWLHALKGTLSHKLW